MAAIDDFKIYLLAEAAKLENVFDRHKCLVAIESWFSAAQSLDAIRGTTTSGYSLNGRSVSRHAIDALRKDCNTLQAEIESMLCARSMILVDNRGEYEVGWPVLGGNLA